MSGDLFAKIVSIVDHVPRHVRGKSLVAAILDSYGNVGVAVATKRSMRWQARHDELLLIVPNFKVREPVPWAAIPTVIFTAHNYLDWWIETRNDPDFGGFREHVTMYKLRKLENAGTGPRRSLHLPDIAYT